jgi:hypothetical protein
VLRAPGAKVQYLLSKSIKAIQSKGFIFKNFMCFRCTFKAFGLGVILWHVVQFSMFVPLLLEAPKNAPWPVSDK